MRAWSKDGLDRLDELVARHVAADGVPGAAWLVARDGEVHVGTAGCIDGSGEVCCGSAVQVGSAMAASRVRSATPYTSRVIALYSAALCIQSVALTVA